MPEFGTADPMLCRIMEALAIQMQSELSGTADPVIEQLQVYWLLEESPSLPSVDIYPGDADEFQTGIGFGKGNNQLNLTVRARVGTAEYEGGQILLLSMMDPWASTSVAQAIMSDRTLGGLVGNLNVEGPSGYGAFVEKDGKVRFGCTWLVRVIP